MKTCKEVNIPLCPVCDDISSGECWLIYWKYKFHPKIGDFIKQYQDFPTNIIDTDYKLYFLQAAKLFYPQLYDKLLKLAILE
jgi:hypothetical protein